MNRTLCACVAALALSTACAGCVKRVNITPEEAKEQGTQECAIRFHRFHTMQKHADYFARTGMDRQAFVTYEQAIGALDEIRKMDPFWNTASVRECRRGCRIEMERLFGRLKIRDLREGEALERFIAGHAEDSRDPAPYAELGVFYFNEHEYDNAMAQYREALLRDSSNIPVLISMAQILSRTGDLEGARQIYSGILDANPDLAVVHYNLGGIYFMMQKPTNAYREYTRALELDRDSPDTSNALGMVCKQLKRYDQAEAHFKNAIRINPNYAPAYHNLGLVFMEEHNYPNATTYLQRAIDLFGPESPRGREIAELIRNRRRSP